MHIFGDFCAYRRYFSGPLWVCIQAFKLVAMSILDYSH